MPPVRLAPSVVRIEHGVSRGHRNRLADPLDLVERVAAHRAERGVLGAEVGALLGCRGGGARAARRTLDPVGGR